MAEISIIRARIGKGQRDLIRHGKHRSFPPPSPSDRRANLSTSIHYLKKESPLYHDLLRKRSQPQETMKNTTHTSTLARRFAETLQAGLTHRRLLSLAGEAIRIAEKGIHRRGLRRILSDIVTLGKILKYGSTGKSPIPKQTLVSIGGVVAYVLCPVDVICDLIPVAGQTDDAGLVAALIASLGNTIRLFEAWEQGSR